MKIIKYIIGLVLLASAFSANANRDERISRTFGSNLHNPYNMKVQVINEACPEKIEPKVYEGNVFWRLGITTTGMTCSKGNDNKGGLLNCSGSSAKGTIKVSALRQELLEELGVPHKYRKDISGVYTQNFDISLALTGAYSNRRGYLGGGDPSYFDFNDYRNPYSLFCTTTEDVIYYYDEKECGISPKPPKAPKCKEVEVEDHEKSFFDEFGEFLGFGTKTKIECEKQPSYCGDGKTQSHNDNGENEECDGGDDCSATCKIIQNVSEPTTCAATPIQILSDNISPEFGAINVNSNGGKCKKVLGDNVCLAGESSLSLKGELSGLGAYKTSASGMTYIQTAGNKYEAMIGGYYSCKGAVTHTISHTSNCNDNGWCNRYKTYHTQTYSYPSGFCGKAGGNYVCLQKPTIKTKETCTRQRVNNNWGGYSWQNVCKTSVDPSSQVKCSGDYCVQYMNDNLCSFVPNNSINLGTVPNIVKTKYTGKVKCEQDAKGYECFAEDMSGTESYSIGTKGLANIAGKAVLNLYRLHELGIREIYYETNNYENNSGYDTGNTISKEVVDKNKFDFDITSNKFSEDKMGNREGLQGKNIFTIAGNYTLGFFGKLRNNINDTWTPYKTIKLIILPKDGGLRPEGDLEITNNGVYANDRHEVTICQKFTDEFGNEVKYGYRDASKNIVYKEVQIGSGSATNYFKINNPAPLDAVANTGDAITVKRVRFTTDSKLCGDIVSKTPFSKPLELSLRAPSNTFDYPMKFSSALNNKIFTVTTPVNVEFKKPYKGSLALVDNSGNKLSNKELKVSRPLRIEMNIVPSTNEADMPQGIGVAQFRDFLLEENKSEELYVIKHVFEHRKNGSLLDKPYEKINIDFGVKPNQAEGISLKAETTKISYQYPDGKTARYLLTAKDDGNDTTKIVIDSLGKPLFGVKIIGAYQAGGQLGLSNQSGNVSDLASSTLRPTIKKNAQELIKNMSHNQTINKVRLYVGDVRYSTINNISSLETVIIKDGNLIIDDNINPSSKLGFILLRSDQSKETKGHVYITPDVTYIKAIVYADGSVKSVNNAGVVINSRDTSIDELKKQLTIKGSLFTRNTIGGALGVEGKYTLPGGQKIDSNNEDNFTKASEFDLNFLRIGNDGCDKSSPANDICTDSGEYEEPLIIEYDPMVQTNPPKGFK